MADQKDLENKVRTFASRAVECDKNGIRETAAEYYMKAAEAILTAKLNGLAVSYLEPKAEEYISRAEFLKGNQLASSSFAKSGVQDPLQSQAEYARSLIEKGFEEDEAGHKEEACRLYLQAAELCLKLKNQSTESEFQTKVSNLAAHALDRAEELKGVKKSPSQESGFPSKVPTSSGSTKRVPRPLGDALREDDRSQASNTRPAAGPPTGAKRPSHSSEGYTKEELQVLRATSVINDRQYVPFMAIDLQEPFSFRIPFSDKDGFLALSAKQKSEFTRWVRPDERCTDPQLIYTISCLNIKQTIISDCSFVASLAIAASYENKFNKKLITSIIYPQNRNGEPKYNISGKYMIQLNINGVLRKIIIDDYLPVGRHGQLLCSYSNNPNELWVSLLEKAYMKVMGGYDFPGSNSNIDLHALTGWIPERVSLQQKESDKFNPDKEYERVHDRFHHGDCLVTMATGDLSEADADRAGLVPGHAYAVLDIKKVKNFRLFQLKNPWAHLSWKGNWSEKDANHWTPEMMRLLNFDPHKAEVIDNGVFWIDYESLLKFFDVLYINWNPALFPYTSCTHHTWTAKEGPKKDSYNISDNPQFRLQLLGTGPCAVWVLLTRHITDKADFANNKEFITLLVYNSSKGKRVFYPYNPPPYKDGVRINSPHYLCKMVENVKSAESSLYTLVVSQYEKSTTLHFTLRVYASCDFKLNKIVDPYNPKFEKEVTGEWKGQQAGGCANYDTYTNNPVYQLRIDNSAADNMILIELKGPKQFSVGFAVNKISENISGCATSITKETSGTYSSGYCYLQLDHLPGGIYNITPTTFKPREEGPFFLTVNSSVKISISRLV